MKQITVAVLLVFLCAAAVAELMPGIAGVDRPNTLKNFAEPLPGFVPDEIVRSAREEQASAVADLPEGVIVGIYDGPDFSSTGVHGLLPEFEGVEVRDERDIEDRLPEVLRYLGLVGEEAYTFLRTEYEPPLVRYLFLQTIAGIPIPQNEAAFVVDSNTALIKEMRIGAFLDVFVPRVPNLSEEEAIATALRLAEPDPMSGAFALSGHTAEPEYRLASETGAHYQNVMLGWRVHLLLAEPVPIPYTAYELTHSSVWVGSKTLVVSNTNTSG